MAARLRALGAEVVESPVIRTETLPGEAPAIGDYDLVCVTSPNGVEALFERLRVAGLDARVFGGVRVAAIGPGTARALELHGIRADIIPERFVAEGLVEALADIPVHRALIARAAVARDVLPDALRERGAQVDVVSLYRTVIDPLSTAQLAAVAAADYLTFTSSSTVTNFLEAAGRAGAGGPAGGLLGGAGGPAGWLLAGERRPRLVSIGPVTSATMREHGLEPDAEAERHDIDGLIDALVEDSHLG
jgi:uroporphyrinogen III methyltransferase/synthase